LQATAYYLHVALGYW